MKKVIFLSLIVIGAYFQQGFAQCNPDELCNACVPKLSEAGFNFLKTYKIVGESDLTKVEYSYVFTKGTQYMISLCDQNATGNTIMVTIFDAERNKVANNKVNGQLLPAIAYPCNATGIYYLQFTFEGGGLRCGGSALGFKK